jgi:hypothetical protein
MRREILRYSLNFVSSHCEYYRLASVFFSVMVFPIFFLVLCLIHIAFVYYQVVLKLDKGLKKYRVLIDLQVCRVVGYV